jgi:hypothetical protein
MVADAAVAEALERFLEFAGTPSSSPTTPGSTSRI